MIINALFPQGTQNLPQSFVNAVNYVVNFYEQTFNNVNVTLNIDYLYGEQYDSATSSQNNIQFQQMPNATPSGALLGNNQPQWNPEPYSQVVSKLPSDGLPKNSPFGNDTLLLTSAQQQALGFSVPPDNGLNGTDIDGVVGIVSNAELQAGGWTSDWTTAAPTNANQFYMIGTIEHETSEVMGRDSFDGTNSDYTIMDLFRYALPNQTTRALTPGGSSGPSSIAYFSINGGKNDLGTWNNYAPNGDLGDWGPLGGGIGGGPGPAGNDAFDNISDAGVVNGFTTTDLTLMNVLGWKTSVPPNEIPNGVTGWVAPGQTSDGLIVEGGGLLVVGGAVNDTTVLNGGTLELLGGAMATGTTVSAGGDLQVSSGYALESFAVASGVTVEVESGGTASGTTVEVGGVLTVESGGLVSGTVLVGGITDGGIAYDSGITRNMVIGPGAGAFVLSGGVESNTVLSGGINNVDSKGSALHTTVDAGGQAVYAGGTASGTVVNSGGDENLGAGTSAGTLLDGGTDFATVVSSGGFENVHSRGTANGTILSGGIENVYSGGTASGTVIGLDATQNVFAGGKAVGTKFQGGTQNVMSGATVSGADLTNGTQFVSSGGTAINTMIDGGSWQFISAGGKAIDATVEAHDIQSVWGVASGTVLSGGEQIVGGIASGTMIDSGGIEYVYSGGMTSATTINGGTLEVLSGGSVEGAVTFVGSGGDLTLLASTSFSPHFGPIDGFGGTDTIDLRDITYGPNTTLAFKEAANNTSGTLTVTDGTHTASLLLMGQYTAANFALASDVHWGGTMITDPPVNQGSMMAHPHG
jgi:autotransporter passenger strand-loop-strand repeat protein